MTQRNLITLNFIKVKICFNTYSLSNRAYVMQQLIPKYSQNLPLKISGKSVYLCESYGRIVDNASNHMVAISFHDTLWFMGVW